MDDFFAFLKVSLENKDIPAAVEEIKKNGSSTAKTSPEGIFCREFLCPTIAKYFYDIVGDKLGLSPEEIKKGLGVEALANSPGFGFKPVMKRRHILTKGTITEDEPPATWFIGHYQKPDDFKACPDFALQKPLPFSTIGEVKYFRKGSVEYAKKEFFKYIKEVIFYMASYRKEYDSALLIIADESPDKAMMKCFESLHPDIRSRFGEETGIYILVIGL